ncbi:tryptophan synthase subunit alpha [Bordetella trematum]|uniref:Tryptophan synthase alpha chain n=1 Tax=Bordetella trematum TaxID=123899 RepID=A0A157N4I1_9BORD|nr:tryptophan synthase subunit alpha [Bordetella trematum]QIM72046.1 tryptophan synthase subunit alpha [Bordetella trematum]SAI15914.1 tryptophan synthase subunit alpha [Bordetella trematum]SAI70933.1 tryptophan synthase subunit alpha [Bordetella trematum]SUV98466.1 tryptophan synthase subunit alpha [Bordetella trematum]VDH07859.1 Tryptophan synthase alpha chain [Bordetella trematum]
MTMTDRIAAAFARLNQSGRASALIPYIAAGDPAPAITVPLMHALVKAGADIVELGVPFSDPMADGPVIQRAAERAIAQGMGLGRVLDTVAEFRRDDSHTPVVLMGYANPIEAMGQQVFVERASAAGVDGLLVVDYPPEEMDAFAGMLEGAGIAPIFLLAPTSTEARMQAVGRVARGYVYYVSLKGVTGSGTLNTDDVAQRLAVIRRHVGIPVGVGFGIRDAESASRIAQHADAVVIGSKLIETMEQAVASVPPAQQADAAIEAASQWLAGVRRALDQVKRERTSA